MRGGGACKSPCCCMQIDRRKSLLIFKKKKRKSAARQNTQHRQLGSGVRSLFSFFNSQHFPAIIFPEKKSA